MNRGKKKTRTIPQHAAKVPSSVMSPSSTPSSKDSTSVAETTKHFFEGLLASSSPCSTGQATSLIQLRKEIMEAREKQRAATIAIKRKFDERIGSMTPEMLNSTFEDDNERPDKKFNMLDFLSSLEQEVVVSNGETHGTEEEPEQQNSSGTLEEETERQHSSCTQIREGNGVSKPNNATVILKKALPDAMAASGDANSMKRYVRLPRLGEMSLSLRGTRLWNGVPFDTSISNGPFVLLPLASGKTIVFDVGQDQPSLKEVKKAWGNEVSTKLHKVSSYLSEMGASSDSE